MCMWGYAWMNLLYYSAGMELMIGMNQQYHGLMHPWK